MAYKLIALDIDGTIRSNEYPLSDRTRSAIARVAAAGVAVTVATGRTFQSAVRASSSLELNAPIVSFQGAHIADPATGEVLWHRPLTRHMAVAALNALPPSGLEVMAYQSDEIFVADMTERVEGYAQRNKVNVRLVDDLRELASEGLTRLVVIGSEAQIKTLEGDLKSRFDSEIYVTRSLAHFCEILHPDAGKHKALAWLCESLGIGRQETIAFGNGYNDIHMLVWAGLGISIRGAEPEVLEVADRVAPPVEEDGAAQVLEELLAQGLIG